MGFKSRIIDNVVKRKNSIPNPREIGKPGSIFLFNNNMKVILVPINTPIRVVKKGITETSKP